LKKKSGEGEDEEDEVEDVGEEVGGSAAPDALHRVLGRVSYHSVNIFVSEHPPPKSLAAFL
jgi:hypothetical protein